MFIWKKIISFIRIRNISCKFTRRFTGYNLEGHVRKQMKAKITALSLRVVEKKRKPFREQFKVFKIQQYLHKRRARMEMEHQRRQHQGLIAAGRQMVGRKVFCSWSPRKFKRRRKQSFRGERAKTLGMKASEDTHFGSFSNTPQSEIPEYGSPAETKDNSTAGWGSGRGEGAQRHVEFLQRKGQQVGMLTY